MEACDSSPFDRLPNELSLWTFGFLSARDIARTACVCRLWHQLSATQLLWKNLYLREYHKPPSKHLLKETSNDWKRAYKCTAKLERNWREAKYEHHILKGHQGRIWALQLDYAAGQLLSASADGDLRHWDIHTRQTLKTFKGHSDEVFCLQFDHTGPGGRMVSGSYDNTIKIWDIDAGTELKTIRGHTRWVRGIRWHHNRLVSASGDHTVKFWDTESGVALATLLGHRETVVCLHYNGDDRTVVSGSADGDAFLWDVRLPHTVPSSGISIGQPVRIFHGHTKTIVSLQLDTACGLLATASSDTSVKLWDFGSGRCTATLGGAATAVDGDGANRRDGGHTGIVTAVQFDHSRLVSGSCDGSVKVWSWAGNDKRKDRSGALMYSLNQESPVYAVTFDTVLASGDDAHNIVIWDFAADIYKGLQEDDHSKDELEEGEEEEAAEFVYKEADYGADSSPENSPKPPKRRRECTLA